MSDFKITGPGFYKTRDGDKVEIVGVSSDGYWLGLIGRNVGAWCSTGSARNATARDIIAPWTEPKTGEFWTNIFVLENGAVHEGRGKHFSKGEADRDASRMTHMRRIACVKTSWTEGDGL